MSTEDEQMAQTLNDIFLEKVKRNSVGEPFASFIREKLAELCPGAVLRDSEVTQIANVITLHFTFLRGGEKISHQADWTKHELLTETRPITAIIEDEIKKALGL
jgi:hypothetical protein